MNITKIIILAIAMSSCSQLPGDNSPSVQEGWHYEEKISFNFIFGLSEIDKSKVLTNMIRKDFSRTPYEKDYSKITIWKVFQDDKTNSRYYVFNIDYVDDIYVVYVVDEKSNISDKFLLSDF